MDYAPEEYSRYYIVEALFRLMSQYEYDKIKVTDIVAKAGVGRVTFYRYFKKKEDVILYYFEHNARSFELSQKYYPRCKDDYITVATEVFAKFRENAQVFRLIRKARLEYVYLDYLNLRYRARRQKRVSSVRLCGNAFQRIHGVAGQGVLHSARRTRRNGSKRDLRPIIDVFERY